MATRFEQVVSAWHLVYVAYRRLGLVDPNEYEIHTSRQAASPQGAVIVGEISSPERRRRRRRAARRASASREARALERNR